jgi:hypothetical protein
MRQRILILWIITILNPQMAIHPFRALRKALTGRPVQAVKEITGQADRERESARRRHAQTDREDERRRRTELDRQRRDRQERSQETQASREQLGRGVGSYREGTARRAELPPDAGTYVGSSWPSRVDRIERESLPIWTKSGHIEWIRARNLSSQDRKSIVDYWRQIWDFEAGLQRDIGDWTGRPIKIGGHWIETSLDAIEDTIDSVEIPLPSEDIYQEI